MMTPKNYYGIDLGITQSTICRVSNGVPVILKTDTLKDTMPSCVSVTRRGTINVGDSAINDRKNEIRSTTKSWHIDSSNVFVEFKRTMGSDKVYHSSNLNRNFTSEELSAEVLKALKALVTDDNIDSVVVTVPVKYNYTQKSATMDAAKLAGFSHCELIPEPIAASMAYGLSSLPDDSVIMVFSFADCAFEVSLVRFKDSTIQVFDAAGHNYLGGYDLVEAIVDNIFIPYLKANYSVEGILADNRKSEMLRSLLMSYAEEAKEQLSFKDSEDIISGSADLGEDEDGDEIELDLTLTQSQVFEVMRPYFQKAVNYSKNLLDRNNISGCQISKLILVGDPTRIPLIRQMLREQITPNIEDSINPKTVLATGAALYASTIYSENKEEDINKDTIRLDIGYESTTIEATEWVSIKLLNESIDSVMVELVRSDKAWSSGKTEVNAMGNVIEAQLLKGKPNSFSVLAYNTKGNILPCLPNEITIIQGVKVENIFLPYTYTFALWSDENPAIMTLRPFKGLEKKNPLPAVGVICIKTSTQLRPTNSSDTISIPVYQADSDYFFSNPAFLYEHVFDIVISGHDINQYIPEGSEMIITLKVDKSEMINVSVTFDNTKTTISGNHLIRMNKKSINDLQLINERDLLIAKQKLELLKYGNQDLSNKNLSFFNSYMDMVIKEMHDHKSDIRSIHQHLKELLRQLYMN